MMNAMIFAAGLGTRLKPYTDNCPKAMVEVGGLPMIAHQLLRLREAGFRRVVINVHHYAQQIIDYVTANDGFGLDVAFSDESGQLLDTGGGIRKALPLFDADSPVLIHNVDIFSNADLAALYRSHQESKADATLLVSQRNTSRYLVFDAALFEFGRVSDVPLYMKVCFFVAWVGVFYALFSKDKYKIIIAILFVCEFIQRMTYFSPYMYYYWPLFYFAILMALAILKKLDDKNRLIRVICVVGVCVVLNTSYKFYMKLIDESDGKDYMPDYITRKITPCDYVFNGDGFMYNIFGKDPHYYWQLIGQLDVIGEKSGLEPKPNMNELILKYKPRFIFGSNYFDKFAREAGRYEIVHYIDKEIVNTYYQKSMFDNFLKLNS